MNKAYFILLLGLLLFPELLSGQWRVEGIVKNATNDQAISEAIIFDQQTNRLIETKANGIFLFENMSEGLHELSIISMGFKSQIIALNIQRDTFLTIVLEEPQIELSTIEIAAKRKEIFALRQLKDYQGTSIYAGKKTEVIILELLQGNFASNNSRQVFSQIAGLNIYEGSDGGLQLSIGGRGLDPNRTSNFNTRQNGYDISADVLGYPENYYTPPAEALEQIQVIRGASSLQYGTQFGGLINFKTKRIPSFKRWEIESNQTVGSFNFFNSFNRIGFNHKKLSVNSYYNYKQGDGYRNNSDFTAHNAFINLNYRINKRSHISADYSYYNYLAKQAGGLTDKMFEETPRLSTRDRNWFDVNWSLFNIKYEYDISLKSRLSVRAFGLNASRYSLGYRGNPVELNQNPITALDEQRPDGSYISPRDLIKGRFVNGGLEAKYLFEYLTLDRKSIGLIGAKFFRSRNQSFQGPGSTGIDPDFEARTDDFPDYANQSEFIFPNTNIALFTEQIFYLNPRLSITPGLRLEYIRTESHGQYNQVIFDNANNPIANILNQEDRILPRYFALAGVGLSYKARTSINWYANISQNYRSVTFSDIRVVSPTFIVDPDISDETGFTADVGWRGQWKKKMSYDVGFYNIYYNDRIGVILDNRANRVRKNIGTALISGVESLIDFNIKEIYFPQKEQLKFNWFTNTALTHSRYLRSEENNVVGKQVEFIPFINLKTGLQLGYRDFLSTVQFGYVSSQFTDVQNSPAAPDGDNRSGIIGEIPSYSIVDFSMSYRIKNLGLQVGVNNLFNESYFTRRATGYPGPGIIPSEGRSFYATLSYKL